MEQDTDQVTVENLPEIKKPKKFNVVPFLIVIAAIVVFRSFGAKKETPVPTIPAIEEPVVAKTSLVDVFNGQVTIEAGSYYFNPNIIRVRKGEKIKLTLTGVSMMHDLKIDELKVVVPVTKSGESSTIEFTADKVGEYEFYCSIGNHRSQGQIGNLIVTE